MNKKFLIQKNISIKKATIKMKRFGLKSLFIINSKSQLIGSISGGDIRGAVIKNISLNSSIKKIFNENPKYVFFNEKKLSKKLSYIFKKYKIDLVPIVDKNKKIKKIISWSEFYSKKKIKTKKFANLSKYKIKVVIMSGGKGTRLKPFTDILPKPLIPIKDKTIIEYIISFFLKYNLKNYAISTNYKSEIIKSYLNHKFKNIKFHYLEEKKPQGTIGGISRLKSKDTYLVSNCDIYHNFDLKNLIQFHLKNKNHLTLVVAKKKYIIPYGVCKIHNNALTKLIEKPKIDFYINTGLYLIDKKIIKIIPKNKFYNLNDLIDDLADKKIKIGTFKIKNSEWHDVGKWDEFSKAFNHIK